MKMCSIIVAVLLMVCATADRSTAAGALSPISRVVELLKQLSAKIEEEAETEETLYKKFVCWGESNVNTKTASNTAAQSRIDSLNTYIADIEAGRIEFTTERADLTKEIAELSADLETAAALRGKEKADFESAKSEMEQGITALEDAIRILKEATGGASSSMMALKGKLRVGFAARAEEAVSLSRAADLGDRYLSKTNARFLRRLLTADVPVYDWKKLNREATFKKSYKARSGDIQDVLAKLLMTFNTNLAEATAKEKEAKALYDKLAASKGSQKASAEEALIKLVKENGARGMSKAEAQAEVEALSDQVTDDTKYIQQVKDALETKKSEWKERSELRTKEVAAISEAISVLHGDDSRDLFKKSLKSQGYSLLQLRSHAAASAEDSVRLRAAAELQRVAASSKDARLQALVNRLVAKGSTATRGMFDPVLQAIDSMVEILKTEEENELKQKEQCEKDRAEDTRAAADTSRTIDELTDKKTSLLGEIEEIDSQIGESKDEIAKIQEELLEAKRLREDAAKAYAAAKADDEAAVSLVQEATNILSKFYADHDLMLLSQQKKQAPVSAAGEAPPPPPTTWSAPYGGKTGESTGIISILTMISEDMQKDIAQADEAESTSITEYNKMKTEQEAEIGDLNSLIGTLEGTKSQKEGEIEAAEADRTTKKSLLDALFVKMKDAQPGCDFVVVNFPVRSKNRQIEMDGLSKAKAILQGAEFATPADDTRELKPGDALVQHHTFSHRW